MKIKISTLLIILLVFLLIFCSCDYSLKSKKINLIPYSVMRDNLMFHHIEYDGTAYYLLGVTRSVPDEYILFGDEISVVLVDENGKAYNQDRTEKAWLYQNDENKTYIYYGSAAYTKNKNHANERYDFK